MKNGLIATRFGGVSGVSIGASIPGWGSPTTPGSSGCAARVLRLAGDRTDLEVAVADGVAVVLQQDQAVLRLAEALDVLELALGDRLAERRAVERVAEDLGAVQPVLDVVAADDDAAGVPLARGLQGAVGGGHDVVERRRLPVRPDLGVGVPLVVDQLVLVADRAVAVLEHEVLQAAVAALRDAPVPRQLELPVRLGGDDVTRTARVGLVARGEAEEAVLRDPARAGGIGALVAVPAVEAGPVEEQRPAGLLLGGRQLIGSLRR